MTNKMIEMYFDIANSIINSFPMNYIFNLFYGEAPMTHKEFTDVIVMEFIKYSYLGTLEKHPLRYYLEYNAEDDSHSERMRYKRALEYTQKYKDINYKLLCDEVAWDNKKIKVYEPLIAKDMHNMKNRLEGYELSEMDLFEHENIQDLRIIKSFVENRLFDSKKVSNQNFIKMFEEYDDLIRYLQKRSRIDNNEMAFCTIAFFTLEWKYSFEYLYLIADYMDKNNIKKIDRYSLMATSGPLYFESNLGEIISGENRMLKERQKIIPLLFVDDFDDKDMWKIRTKYVELAGVTNLYRQSITCIEGGLYIDWFKDNTELEDWASFLKNYNLFEVYHKKEWNNKKIKYMRKLLKMTAPFKEIQ